MKKHFHAVKHKVTRHLSENKHLAAAYVLAVIVAVAFFLSRLTPLQAASDGTVTGLLTQPNGTTPIANASVTLHSGNWMYSTYKSTDADGSFTFTSVPAGTYKLEIYAYSSSYFSPDAQTVTVVEGGTTNLGTIPMLNPNVFGKVTSPDGATGLANASVTIRTSDWTINKWASTDSAGVFQTALSTNGTYVVEAWTSSADYSRPDTISITYSGSAVYLDGTNGSTVIKTTNPALRGKVMLTDGTTPAQYASITLADSNKTGVQWASTDANGAFKVDAVASGSYTLKVFPPYDKPGLVGPDPIAVTLTKGTTDTTYQTTPITLSQAVKTITGTVTRSNGQRVTDGNVSAWQYYGGGYGSTTIGSDGTFTLKLGTGEWFVSIYSSWNNGSPDWTYIGSPKKVSFTQSNTVAETATLQYSVLSFSALVKGKVTLPDGSLPSTSDYVSVSAWSDGGGGNWSQLAADGTWSMKLPPGTFNISLYSSSNQYGTPTLSPITLKDDETYDVGTVKLLTKDATITGAVRDTTGRGIANQSVSAWRDGGNGWGWIQTDGSGNYSLPVTAGRWCVNAYPSWTSSQTYVATDEPQCITVAAQSTKADLNFTFAVADATVTGSLVDENNKTASSIYGWLEVRKTTQAANSLHYAGVGGSITGGTFSVKVPAGTWSICPSVGYSGDYSVGDCQTVTVSAGETKSDLSFALVPNNAVVTGSFKDANGKVLTDVFGSVNAQRINGNNWLWSTVDNGTFRLKGAAGTWRFSCWVDPATSAQYYLSGVCDADVTAVANDTVTHDITLQTADSSVTVKTVDPDGNPLPNAFVSVDTSFGETKTVSYGSYGYWFNRNKYTDQNGSLTLKVPAGTYFVSASVPTDFGFINPTKTVITVSADDPAAVTLKFQKPDAIVVGKVTVDGAPAAGASVYASNDDGGFAETTTDADGNYRLAVTKDTWDIVTASEDAVGNVGRREGAEVAVTQSGTVNAGTIALGDGKTETTTALPEAVSVTAATNAQIVVNTENGASLTAPANSIAAQNTTVSVTITPTVLAPDTSTDVLENPIVYDVTIRQQSGQNAGQEVTNLPSDITLTLPYDEAMVIADGVAESDLTVKYWDDAADAYRSVKTVTVNETANTITATVNHATKFAITSRPVEKKTTTPGLPATSTPTTDSPTAAAPTLAPVVTPEVTVLSTKQLAVLTTDRGRAPLVTVYNPKGTRAARFRPFSMIAAGDFTLAAGDVTGDKVDELFVYDRRGRQTTVAAYSLAGKRLGNIALAKGSRPSVTVADLNDDATAEIILAADNKPNLSVYAFQRRRFNQLATAQPFISGGTKVSVGNVTGDNDQELVVASRNTTAQIAVYDFNAKRRTLRSLAGLKRGDLPAVGADVTLTDVAGDKHAEILWRPSRGNGRLAVATVKDRTLATLDSFNLPGSAALATGDLTGDGKADILTSSADRTTMTLMAIDKKRTKLRTVATVDPFRGPKSVSPMAEMVARDLDADGKPEVMVSRGDGKEIRTFQLVKNSLTRVARYAVSASTAATQRLFPVDVNGDGRQELVTMPSKNPSTLTIMAYRRQVLTVSKRISVGRNYRGELEVAMASTK